MNARLDLPRLPPPPAWVGQPAPDAKPSHVRAWFRTIDTLVAPIAPGAP